MSISDTIFALASGAGVSGVAIIRVSGPRALTALDAFACKPVDARMAALRRLIRDGEVLDDALVLRFEEGSSFTGEPVVEFQTHGSPAVISAVLERLSALPGFRTAEAGEFTRRSFEHGKLDLVQVDGLAKLIEAETESQRKQAVRVFAGELSDELSSIRQNMLRAAALCEAVIDFVDEEVPVDVSGEVGELVQNAIGGVRRLLSGAAQARRIQTGYEVAIIGPPNAGKSSLINALTKRDVAIVSDVAGTTRDVLEARLNLDGLLVSFLDTAGLRVSDDEVERAGIERARTRAANADMRLFLQADKRLEFNDLWEDGDISVETKADLTGKADAISSRTGYGIEGLLEQIKGTLGARSASAGIMSSVRHEEGLKDAEHSLSQAKRLLETGQLDELVAEELRAASRNIEKLLGRIDVEDILGEVFSSFCIGK